jgi:hypothetical protein
MKKFNEFLNEKGPNEDNADYNNEAIGELLTDLASNQEGASIAELLIVYINLKLTKDEIKEIKDNI